ncbi:hypothetical protein H112_06573 [Trichophyton rubrum D6]|uniref:Uncharacterized protein n=3 Tax=Trichophyton TaxID=5550 RepID=A0A080WJB9_TRIRC|nr:uncharacterized protein TERG_11775 [Trichophyton rubrum CBS 118892]EZF12454.1 hypothetical protein H100_06590 [Trichophyton rubrum MR850]EZF39219.1 hypothetical protein H102_06557 [Trichophyton rubrum CBS 100081]EZF49866.1 hypothetical protein H103_06582 [Trichophyton rubrum CBS 288.86]EZF60502.1 hypothetical protein H104_06537 [Trichophyton rubrum CBS 289.86]EZF71187.1 hypothetical protein H105_06594 [Trichophyton soudanense CBS 452.61]EZF81916.1 hypothetical protein H110_06577 [Trichophy
MGFINSRMCDTPYGIRGHISLPSVVFYGLPIDERKQMSQHHLLFNSVLRSLSCVQDYYDQLGDVREKGGDNNSGEAQIIIFTATCAFSGRKGRLYINTVYVFKIVHTERTATKRPTSCKRALYEALTIRKNWICITRYAYGDRAHRI